MLDTQYTSAKCECLCCIHRCTTSQRAFPLRLPIMEQRQIPMSLSCHRITTKQTKLSSFLISHLSFANIYLSQSLIIQQPNHRPNPQTHQRMPCIPYVHGGISPPPSTPPSKKSPSNPTDSPPKTLETTHDAKGTSAGYVKDRSRHTASGPFNANLTTPHVKYSWNHTQHTSAYETPQPEGAYTSFPEPETWYSAEEYLGDSSKGKDGGELKSGSGDADGGGGGGGESSDEDTDEGEEVGSKWVPITGSRDPRFIEKA